MNSIKVTIAITFCKDCPQYFSEWSDPDQFYKQHCRMDLNLLDPIYELDFINYPQEIPDRCPKLLRIIANKDRKMRK